MVRQVTERNTITLPKKVLEHIGVKSGDFLEISEKDYQIILRPKILEDPYSEGEWGKLEKLSRLPGKVYKSGKEAKEHLRKL